VFSKPEIKQLLDEYVVVQLYTDQIPPKVQKPATSWRENRDLLTKRFGSAQLPLYVILSADDQEIARYEEGKINNVDGFADFLRKPLETQKAGKLQPIKEARKELGDFKQGLEEAGRTQENVLLEFAALSDTNSATNINTVMTRPDVRELTDQYVLVRLYIDKVPSDIRLPASAAKENLELLHNQFETGQEPLYIVLKPDGKAGTELARYEVGQIKDIEEFKTFLRKSLGKNNSGTAAASR
jgi:hypothetical protein